MTARREEALSYTNSKGATYYLHQRRTESSAIRYYAAKTVRDGALTEMPAGFEFSESVNGVVNVRRVRGEKDSSCLRGHAPYPLAPGQFYELARRLFEALGEPLRDPREEHEERHDPVHDPEDLYRTQWRDGDRLLTLTYTYDHQGPLESRDSSVRAWIQGLPGGVRLDLEPGSPPRPSTPACCLRCSPDWTRLSSPRSRVPRSVSTGGAIVPGPGSAGTPCTRWPKTASPG
jgi:hypothetical protein